MDDCGTDQDDCYEMRERFPIRGVELSVAVDTFPTESSRWCWEAILLSYCNYRSELAYLSKCIARWGKFLAYLDLVTLISQSSFRMYHLWRGGQVTYKIKDMS